jgi:hypothetical protein
VKTCDEFPRPPEPRIVGPPENELHRVAVAANESLVLGSHVCRALADQDAAHLVDGDGNLLDPDRGRNGLGLEIAPHATLPAT